MIEVGWSVTPTRWARVWRPRLPRRRWPGASMCCELDEIVSFTMPRNTASRRVMEKLGMAYVRDFDREGLTQVLYRRPDS